jgi:hypothetical protein
MKIILSCRIHHIKFENEKTICLSILQRANHTNYNYILCYAGRGMKMEL